MRRKLEAAWRKRLALREKSNKIFSEGEKLIAKGAKLQAKGDEVFKGSDKSWEEAIQKLYGDIQVEWKYNSTHRFLECHLHLPNGRKEVYGWKDRPPPSWRRNEEE